MRLMRKSLTISVTQEDIDNGVSFSVCDCPVARAVRRKFPKARVSVGVYTLTITARGRVRSYYLPREAIRFISVFDCRGNVEPITFTATR
jgi:hypothetical protein